MIKMDEKHMQHALQLARLGGRAVAPNPMVGAVIVKGGKVIGEGYHRAFGDLHAEIEAIQSVKKKMDLEGATMYVTLEPCRHFGKTPPCLDFVGVMGVKRVVCGSRDPFQQGFQVPDLKSQIEFLNGEVNEKCQELNKFFLTWVSKRRPYITVKIAVSADGFVAGVDGKPVHLTTAGQDEEVHQLRAQHQAIMVGINTVLNDDPRLDVRLVKGRDPLRIVLDSELRIPSDAKVLKDDNHLIATCREQCKKGMNIWKSPTKKKVCLRRLFKHLGEQGISSVLVEPGPTLYKSLKKQGLIDELIIYKGKKRLSKGLRIDL